jgi:hypothetical protein
MGDAAEAIMNGEVCQECGEAFMDEAPGYPRSCGACDPDACDDEEPFTDDADYGLDPEDDDEGDGW